MPNTTLTWATRKPIKCFAAAEAASKRSEGGPLLSRVNPRGPSPTAS